MDSHPIFFNLQAGKVTKKELKDMEDKKKKNLERASFLIVRKAMGDTSICLATTFNVNKERNITTNSSQFYIHVYC